MQKNRSIGNIFAAASLLAMPALAEEPANPATALEAPSVEVIGTTPLPSIGTPIQQVPSNVQAATGAQMEEQHSQDLTQFLEQNLTSVNINSAQGNPFQPDVDFRGFTASPLLGTPQGLSVFQDGVRVNESFGDTVNWDLIPQSAISSINLIPGSNPVFGLNTLGGSLAIQTKSGFEYPGYSIESYGGSFATNSVVGQAGGHGEHMDYFLTGNYFSSDGFHDHDASSSTVQQWFGKVGYQDSTTDIDLIYTGASNNLQGAQTIPISFYNVNSDLVYSFPDITKNKLNFFNLKASHFFTDNNLVTANAYYRQLAQNNFESNTNDDFDPTLPVAPGNAPGLNEQTSIDTNSYGGTLQYSYLGNLFNHNNQFTAGGSMDLGSTTLTQSEQEAAITPDGNTNAILLTPFSLINNVQGNNYYYGAYFTNNFSMTNQVNFTASGRYNYAKVKLGDLTGLNPSLDGDNTYTRFNPAAGVNYNPNKALTAYASYSEGMRAPTPVELTCSNPSAPCSLPNAFISDPPLKAVVSRTWEVGARGQIAGNTAWRMGLFSTKLSNDIEFISTTTTTGFFQNVGDTLRQGLELGFSTKQGRLSFAANYSYINATFQTPFLESSPNNTTADANGQILVTSGNRIPGIPRNSFKARVDYSFTDKFVVGASMQAYSSQIARGDENNLDPQGTVGGYAVVNLNATYEILPRLQFFANVNNLFDKKYANMGILGSNFFTGPNNFDPNNAFGRPELFVGSGAPIAGFVGIRYSLGTTKKQRDLD
ncbi:MAG TPA: TonB-dependent receptor [Burkholderiales bacterium]|nr:TonB-dependent receptor [Burkholderiales bacterium]